MKQIKQKISLVAMVIALIFFISCSGNQNKDEQKGSEVNKEEVTKKKDCNDVHWSHHKGNDGPRNWKSLCDGFSDCGGNSQSPININSIDVVNDKELVAPDFNYDKTRVNIINNTHTVQFNVDNGNKVTLNGKEYELLQFHYHALSEHTIDGKYYPIEVHFVHKHSDTDFAVFGVMFVEGKENDLFKKYLDKFPTQKGEYKSDEIINLLDLFPKNKSYYHYNGSLTTPPCTEIVSWYVLRNPVEASKEQIEKLSNILNNNYRPIKSLNSRKVKLYSE